MGEEKGKLTKKILHIGHLLLEFLRNVVKAIGKPDKPQGGGKAVKKAGAEGVKGTSKTAIKSGTQVAKGVAKTAATKSSSMWGSSLGSALSSVGSAVSSTVSTVAGLAGVVITAKTLGVTIVAAVVLTGGLSTYSYVTDQDPLQVLENIFNPDETPGDTENLNPNAPENLENGPLEEDSSPSPDEQVSPGQNQGQISQSHSVPVSPVSPGGTDRTISPSPEHYPGVDEQTSDGEDEESETGQQPIDYEIP